MSDELSFKDKKDSVIQSLASGILELDPSISGCHIVADPAGALVAEIVRPGSSFGKSIGSLHQIGSGMGPLWGMRAVNALMRMNGERSAFRYATVVRDGSKTLLFPVSVEGRGDFVFGLDLTDRADPSIIYVLVLQFISKNSQQPGGRNARR